MHLRPQTRLAARAESRKSQFTSMDVRRLNETARDDDSCSSTSYLSCLVSRGCVIRLPDERRERVLSSALRMAKQTVHYSENLSRRGIFARARAFTENHA